MLKTLLEHSGRVAGLGWAMVALLWLLDAAGRGPPAAIDRLAVLLAAAALAVWAAREVRRLWTGDGEERAAGRLLLLLLGLSLAFHFVGLGHEAASRYFGDEGIYRERAVAINGGQLFRPWFIYPHLLFYLDALALWLASLFEPAVLAAARLVGVEGETGVATLVTRWVTAACGALTVLPVFAIARRVAGTAAAALAGAFAVLSPIYLEVCHLNISDVPSALFATLTLLQVSRLLDRERASDYVLAGLWAGLAAGSKYPAGVVAVAIVAIWVRWRIRDRRFGWGLLGAGLVALGAFVAATPSLLVFPDKVFRDTGVDILFGYRQYARAGWTGVVRDSNVWYYLGLLRHSFGEPVLALGLAGLATLGRTVWARLAWLLPFPALYLLLLLRMEMSVPRNLLPVLPMLAVVLGVGAAGWYRWLARRRPAIARPVLAALAAVCLALPAVRSSAQAVRLARPTTRELAAAWMKQNLPPGSFLVQEAYTPRIDPPFHFPSRRPRFMIRLSREELRDPQHDFLFLASGAYQRFFNLRNRRHDAEFLELSAERYREIFERFELVREFVPGRLRAGPVLRLYRTDPDPPVYAAERRFAAAEALVREERMRPPGADALVHVHPKQWSLFKAHLEAGRYRVELDAELGGDGGTVRVMNRDNQEIASQELAGAGAEVELPRADKYFLYVHLPAGRLRGLEVARIAAEPVPAGVRGGPAG